MVHSEVNLAVTMFTLVKVDVNLCHACKKSINNTQNEVERHPGPRIHSRLASCGPERRVTLDMNRSPLT
ncbi:hypothetical protein NP493_975g03000 [Ridgeia piscesae]|uniref:Uncharacterized protein n=1 Tax=Ridgeia piscesae TaxID=27915 RepID=A0AAD9KJD3_RIDPI|nr:hypothetical protein NP493_975g03000 [Ridgeia piscesae]